MRLVQLHKEGDGRRVAVVDGPRLRILQSVRSVYELAFSALESGIRLAACAEQQISDESLDYDPVYTGQSEWRILPAFDHPTDPTRCLVCGTGLTHIKSAANRQSMHAGSDGAPSDSMKMYEWGLSGGRPAAGQIGVQPEWFYKGNGHVLKALNEPLEVPSFACDGGEEAEIAGAYVIDGAGKPWRIGLMAANEFSDHVMEAKNYLYLAPSKLRQCSIGPELVVDPQFQEVKGRAEIRRAGEVVWSEAIATGEASMSHSLANLEHHHFKYPQHRVPGDAHVYFLGADAFSFGSHVTLKDGDEMTVEFAGFGRPLRNPIAIRDRQPSLVRVGSL